MNSTVSRALSHNRFPNPTIVPPTLSFIFQLNTASPNLSLPPFLPLSAYFLLPSLSAHSSIPPFPYPVKEKTPPAYVNDSVHISTTAIAIIRLGRHPNHPIHIPTHRVHRHPAPRHPSQTGRAIPRSRPGCSPRTKTHTVPHGKEGRPSPKKWRI